MRLTAKSVAPLGRNMFNLCLTAELVDEGLHGERSVCAGKAAGSC